VKTDQKLPYCEPCNILFTNPKDLITHNQENHQSQPTLTIPPPLRPIDTVFYNEVEITKKLRPIAKKTPITKVIPKVAKTITKSPIVTKPRQAYTVIRPLAPKVENPSEIPVVIKPSSPQKTALEQIMTSQVSAHICTLKSLTMNPSFAATSKLPKASQQEIENTMHSNPKLRRRSGAPAGASQLKEANRNPAL
jgi:Zinc-finger of C2H2 type